jgi:uncharacterized protein YyaL (SSP411 family)
MSDRTDVARNALAAERSPFLQHGATQPVDWMPWGGAAFERALREDRPVLLDIGAVWCHWCHVMDAESYDDPDTAALINAHFVAVKVDRDERPDVDARYQRAVQLLTGQGGWPLTAFLTPDGEVFYGGTYFPPEDRFGRPSFRRVLREVARVWTEERDRAAEAAAGIRERLTAYASAEVAAGEPAADLVDAAVEEWAGSFDFRWGGFGRAPKFPNAGALELLLDRWLEDGTEWAGRIVMETLRAMARGGIHDQLGGGFHRYATDARWLVPHFEKMAYDNGVLLEVYSRAYAATDDVELADVVRGIVAHCRDVAADLVAAGGFPASQDADFGHDNDGDYWTWTEEEIRAAVPDATDFAVARLYYGMDDPGATMHSDPSRRVLFRALDAQGVAARLGMPPDAVAGRIERIRAALKRARDARPRPYVDETLYSGWVAMVVCGHLAAARRVGVDGARDDALRALDRVWRDGFIAGRGVVHRVGDEASGEYLEDQAHVARALLDAYELTQDATYRERARELVHVTRARFTDPATGALLDRPRDAEVVGAALGQPYLPVVDSPAPSGNGTMALVLLRLHALTGEDSVRDAALAVLAAFAGGMPRLATGAATYLRALTWAVRPVTTVVVVTEPGDPAGEALWRTALRSPRPRTVVRRLAPEADPGALPAALRSMLTADAPRAYVCAGRTCAAPVAAADALADVLRTLRG